MADVDGSSLYSWSEDCEHSLSELGKTLCHHKILHECSPKLNHIPGPILHCINWEFVNAVM